MAIALGTVGALLWLSGQVFNLMKPLVRRVLSWAGAALVILAFGLGRGADEWGALAFISVVAGLVVSQKLFAEYTEDESDREDKDMPRLIRHLPAQEFWDPTFTLRYKRALMRDPWSRWRLLRRSVELPRFIGLPRPSKAEKPPRTPR